MFNGTDSDDVLMGDVGNDSFYGANGNDTPDSDAGNDWLSGDDVLQRLLNSRKIRSTYKTIRNEKKLIKHQRKLIV